MHRIAHRPHAAPASQCAERCRARAPSCDTEWILFPQPSTLEEDTRGHGRCVFLRVSVPIVSLSRGMCDAVPADGALAAAPHVEPPPGLHAHSGEDVALCGASAADAAIAAAARPASATSGVVGDEEEVVLESGFLGPVAKQEEAAAAVGVNQAASAGTAPESAQATTASAAAAADDTTEAAPLPSSSNVEGMAEVVLESGSLGALQSSTAGGGWPTTLSAPDGPAATAPAVVPDGTPAPATVDVNASVQQQEEGDDDEEMVLESGPMGAVHASAAGDVAPTGAVTPAFPGAVTVASPGAVPASVPLVVPAPTAVDASMQHQEEEEEEEVLLESGSLGAALPSAAAALSTPSEAATTGSAPSGAAVPQPPPAPSGIHRQTIVGSDGVEVMVLEGPWELRVRKKGEPGGECAQACHTVLVRWSV